ncbi:MAG: tetratricopeptide repeat protein, partial [Bacteroidia bacterium]
DLSRSQYHARTARNIARNQSIKSIQVGDSWLVLGNCYYVQGNYDSAGYAYRQGIPYSESDSAGYQNLPTIYSNIGLIAINQAHYSEGLSWQFKALAIYDSLKQVRGVLRCYNAIAVVYSESGELTRNPDDYANALLYLRKCLALSGQTDDSLGINNVLINIGSVYQRSGSNDSALWYFREAARRAERQKDKLSYSNAVANIAECSQLMGLDEEAEKFALIGLKLKTDEGDQLGVCTINFILGKLYEKRGQKEKSRTAYQESYKIAKLIGANREQSESARRLAELYAGDGNYAQAWLFIGDYVKLNDSISSQQSIQLIQELKARFDDENQKKQIALLTQEKQIAELAATR